MRRYTCEWQELDMTKKDISYDQQRCLRALWIASSVEHSKRVLRQRRISLPPTLALTLPTIGAQLRRASARLTVGQSQSTDLRLQPPLLHYNHVGDCFLEASEEVGSARRLCLAAAASAADRK
ncbi:unnamed protein product [Soboliphyme baturini]|uniref:Uncharacterized protein n=1 Tax=Soboliphyme baturini TaxID=241478 RepID=A0A183IZA9_9BILA|nr:unnamed protein product [Soboliphyme baturini]